ncbi:MAG: carboxypeptidase regulatory-like domain-containing protein, partial [Bryobacteraceae bacterium]
MKPTIRARGAWAVLWWTGHLLAAAGFARAQEAASGGVAVQVEVSDPSRQPVAGVRLTWKQGAAMVTSGETDAEGSATFHLLKAGQYTLSAVKEGFQPLTKNDLGIAGPTTVELTLVERLTQHETVDVEASVPPVEQGASTPTKLPPEVARELPSRPANVAEALPLVPGVVRKPDGALQISGSAEHRSSLIVNSADVSDPATGQFGLTVPIDSVEALNVYQTPYMAEYGRFTAGLVSVETRRGGEKWKWELNDPFPDFYIRSWHLRGLRDATPRLNVEGPILPGKLYFSEGLEYEVRKIEIYTLP